MLMAVTKKILSSEVRHRVSQYDVTKKILSSEVRHRVSQYDVTKKTLSSEVRHRASQYDVSKQIFRLHNQGSKRSVVYIFDMGHPVVMMIQRDDNSHLQLFLYIG
jgi:hypothetical protein